MGARTVAVLGLAALTLAGCSSVIAERAGDAAHSDLFAVSQAEVDAEVRAFLIETQQDPGSPPPGLATATTQRLLSTDLMGARAAQLGVEVTQAQVDEGRAQFVEQFGGEEGLTQAAQGSGIPAGSLNTFIHTNLLFDAIGAKLTGQTDAATIRTAAAADLATFSEEIGLAVAPRYGTWSAQALQIGDGTPVTQAAPSAAATPADAATP